MYSVNPYFASNRKRGRAQPKKHLPPFSSSPRNGTQVGEDRPMLIAVHTRKLSYIAFALCSCRMVNAYVRFLLFLDGTKSITHRNHNAGVLLFSTR